MLTLLRGIIHTLCFLPLVWLIWALTTQSENLLGADPIKEILHFLGFSAISILLSMFVLSLIFFWLKRPHLQILRRPLGLWAWCYVILHIATYLVLELGVDFSLFINELIRRKYLILGSLAFFILTLMALSSLPQAKKIMGKYWHYLHQLGYLALLLSSIHYYWAVKSLTLSAVAYLILSGVIVAWQMVRQWRAYTTNHPMR